MKIDEAINFVENMLYLYRPTGKHHDEWCELLNLLRWYKNQDLASKQTTKDHLFYEWTNGTMQTIEDILDVVEQIPKAEYRGNEDEERSNSL